MILKFLLFILLTINLIAQSSYEKAITAYNNGEYEKATILFKQSKEEYPNIDMQILWAKSELALGRVQYAIAGYERVLMLQPTNITIGIELVKLYLSSKQEEDAKYLIKEFQKQDITQKQYELLEALIVTQKQKLDKFSTLLSIKMGYDTNVASTPQRSDLNMFAQSINLDENQSKMLATIDDSFYSQALVSLNYFHDLQEKDSWFFETNFLGTIKLNHNISAKYDTKYFKISSILGYKISDITLSLPISYDSTHYLNKNLLYSYALSPSLSTVFQSNYILNTTLKVQKKNYIPESMRSYDSTNYTTEISLYYLFGENYLFGKLSYEKTEANKNTAQIFPPKYIDSNTIMLSLANKYNLYAGYILNTTLLVSFKNYDEKLYAKDSLNHYFFKTDKRKDIFQNIGFGVSKKIFKDTIVAINYKFSRNITDYKMADYQKNDISIRLDYSF